MCDHEDLMVNGSEAVTIGAGTPQWDDVVALRRQSHYIDCCSHTLPRESYDAFMAGPEAREPAWLSLKELLDDPNTRLVGWYQNGQLVGAATLRLGDLQPGRIYGLLVDRVFLGVPADKHFVSGLLTALHRYAQKRRCRVVRIEVARHTELLRRELEAHEAHLANAQYEWVLVEE